MTVTHSNPFSIAVTEPSALGTLRFETPTPEQIGLYLPLDVVLPADARAAVRYRRAGETEYREAHPLFRIHPEWVTGGAPEPVVDAFAGTIFDLTPGRGYEIELEISAGGVTELLRGVATTRALPPRSGTATVTAGPSDDLQGRLDTLAPGDVLELEEGTYDVSGLELSVSGMPSMPIVIRGASRDGVILRAPSGAVLRLLETSHVVIEDLTLSGSGADSGTDASSVGIGFWNGAVQEDITFRRLVIEGVDQGIVASGEVVSVLVYDSVLRGNNRWEASFIETNATWNDDGIRLPGRGNCAFQNTLHGFGDSFAVTDGVHSAGVYFYRNRVTMTGDDACEGDYATRNIGFYDNHVSNCATLLSLDPLWGGPLYCFRNVCVNTIRGPFKLNNTNCGFAIYNNTIVRTEGTQPWAWAQPNNGALRNFSYRNNLLVLHGAGGRLIAVESSGNDPIDFTHNGFHPDGSVWWTNSGGSYGSLAEASAGLPDTEPVFGSSRRRHDGDVIVDREPFVDSIPLGASHRVEVTGLYVPRLSATSPASGGGTAIPNVTDGHDGAAPDIGAVIAGREPPTWGALSEP